MSNKEILSGVIHDGVTYSAGMEDELGKAADAKTIAYLTEQGAISGFGKGVVNENEKETGKTPAKNEKG